MVVCSVTLDFRCVCVVSSHVSLLLYIVGGSLGSSIPGSRPFFQSRSRSRSRSLKKSNPDPETFFQSRSRSRRKNVNILSKFCVLTICVHHCKSSTFCTNIWLYNQLWQYGLFCMNLSMQNSKIFSIPIPKFLEIPIPKLFFSPDPGPDSEV